jgi:hypothetical protein
LSAVSSPRRCLAVAARQHLGRHSAAFSRLRPDRAGDRPRRQSENAGFREPCAGAENLSGLSGSLLFAVGGIDYRIALIGGLPPGSWSRLAFSSRRAELNDDSKSGFPAKFAVACGGATG